MNSSTLGAYRALNEAQNAIRRAETLDQALQESLRIIARSCQANAVVIWYANQNDGGRLHPYFWIGNADLTTCVHAAGEGMVGRVYQTQNAERYLEFDEYDDAYTARDFAELNVTSTACMPFSGGDALLGCVQIVKADGGHLTEEEVDVCEIVAMVAGMTIADTEHLQPVWKPGISIMEVRGVTREFQNGDVVTKVLKGVNLDVYEGEFLVLLGESGCGKSTLLNILGGMDHPTSGSFKFYGEEFANASQARLTDYRRDNIGFIFQSYNLMPNLNARQNLELIASLVPNPMDVDECLEIVNLAERKTNYPSQMSGGQQQRVSIARALVKRPSIIMADEPTAALDYTTSIEVLEVMERIVAEGTTMIMVTHNEEICRMADRVVRMRNGQVDEVTINRRKAHATELVW